MRPSRPMPCAAIAALALTISLSLAGVAHADSFTATTTADSNDGSCTPSLCSLRDAVIAANGTTGDDTITLPAGHYTLSIAGAGEDAAATGDLDITDTTGTITIAGAGARTTTVDANGIDRAFDVLAGANLALSGVTITGGNPGTGSGGGIQNVGTLDLSDSTVTVNHADDANAEGGGIYNDGGALTVQRSTISDNTVGQFGAGLDLDAGTVTITNSTITGNQELNGSGGGAGVDIDTSLPVQFTNTTIAGNTDVGSTTQGGPGGVWSNSATNVNFQNTIVADNSPFDCDAPTNSNPGNNLDSDSTCFTGTNDKHGDPKLGPLQDNGGPTDTLALLAGSPAIDAGDSTVAPGTDQRGVTRPLGAAPDIGAYEFSPPAVTTGAASNVAPTSATVSGSVTPYTTATYHFEYGTTTAYGTNTASQTASSGNTPSAASAGLTGLAPATTYHYRLVATNNDGTTFGADQTFTTVGSSPLAVTGPVTNLGQFTATLTGTVNPGSLATTYVFQYGPTTTYGTQTSAQPVSSGSTPQNVSATLAGLQAGKGYHYRLVATNAAGTSTGADRTVTTIGRLQPRKLTVHARPKRDRRLPFRYTFSGAITVPTGVKRSDACNGSVAIQIKNGRKTISNRRQKLTKACTYRQSVTFSLRNRLGHTGRLKVTVRFLGNKSLARKTAKPIFVRFG